jgi:hypothetical protein
LNADSLLIINFFVAPGWQLHLKRYFRAWVVFRGMAVGIQKVFISVDVVIF